MQDADCSNVDEAGFPKDRVGHNAVARRNSFSICTTGEGNKGNTCHNRRGQLLPPQERATSAPQERATLATARGCRPSAALRSDTTWPLGVSDAVRLPGGDPLGP